MPPVSFIELPREIRDRVYDFVYDFNKVLLVKSLRKYLIIRSSFRDKYPKVTPDEFLALLHVNRQISEEAQLSLYGKHTFEGQPSDLCHFLEGPGLRRFMTRRIEVGEVLFFSSDSYNEFFTELFVILSTLSHLRFVKVNMLAKDTETALSKLNKYGISQVNRSIEITMHIKRRCYRAETSLLGWYYVVDVWTLPSGKTEWKTMKIEE